MFVFLFTSSERAYAILPAIYHINLGSAVVSFICFFLLFQEKPLG